MQKQVAAENDWNVLLDKIASGPPPLSPFKLLDPLVNVAEMFIHHEDVRRAASGWEPRELDAGDDRGSGATGAADGADGALEGPRPCVVAHTGGQDARHRRAGPTVVVTGEPAELLMFAAGRDEARLTFSGDDDAVRAVREGRGGL